ncbi:winged helix-turn-helix transcriptional regulator [Candidatus Woesearchaeota archaeon]|jgi:uncharacterized membrane protein|nr:winged helix-turn-helix transcriptional regulator [Candidatus Woesearchaeota archaeon]MBT6044792.1 winged helix-turn-helix transcriptional regulator [Candidatus Woesearchaeota archaeon]
MNQKKLGATILVFSIIIGLVLINFIVETKDSSNSEGCFQTEECSQASFVLNSSHLGIGLIFAMFSLAFYLLIFSRGEEFWLKKLEQQKQDLSSDERWKIVELMLDENELKVIKAVKDQPGITQFTLRLRTDLSKSKLSDILSRFEKKGIVERRAKGKTLSVYLKSAI